MRLFKHKEDASKQKPRRIFKLSRIVLLLLGATLIIQHYYLSAEMGQALESQSLKEAIRECVGPVLAGEAGIVGPKGMALVGKTIENRAALLKGDLFARLCQAAKGVHMARGKGPMPDYSSWLGHSIQYERGGQRLLAQAEDVAGKVFSGEWDFGNINTEHLTHYNTFTPASPQWWSFMRGNRGIDCKSVQMLHTKSGGISFFTLCYSGSTPHASLRFSQTTSKVGQQRVPPPPPRKPLYHIANR
ncbi:MAG: hypothetical protein KGJ34_00300 [Patescibacteria group bacterium]|nr:hypothetical protein [Patescibacteria group bacterium]